MNPDLMKIYKDKVEPGMEKIIPKAYWDKSTMESLLVLAYLAGEENALDILKEGLKSGPKVS